MRDYDDDDDYDYEYEYDDDDYVYEYDDVDARTNPAFIPIPPATPTCEVTELEDSQVLATWQFFVGRTWLVSLSLGLKSVHACARPPMLHGRSGLAAWGTGVEGASEAVGRGMGERRFAKACRLCFAPKYFMERREI